MFSIEAALTGADGIATIKTVALKGRESYSPKYGGLGRLRATLLLRANFHLQVCRP